VKILITGSEGFVGRNFLSFFESRNYQVTKVDVKNGVDARFFFATDQTHFDLVIHLAAVVGGRATIEGNPLAVATDLAIDSDLFQWALRTRPGRIVYFSSSAAYPTELQSAQSAHQLKESDIDLSDIRTPDLTYGWVKLTGEMLAKYAREQGLKVTILRPFSGYGEDQDLDYPFPSFIARGRAKADPFKVWGTGTQVRDFIHIKDVVVGTIAAFEADVEVANLCTGRGTNFLELAQIVMKTAKYSAPILTNPEAPVGVANRVGNPEFMLSFYQPRITLEEGVYLALNK